jgi:hypothetical protein
MTSPEDFSMIDAELRALLDVEADEHTHGDLDASVD